MDHTPGPVGSGEVGRPAPHGPGPHDHEVRSFPRCHLGSLARVVVGTSPRYRGALANGKGQRGDHHDDVREATQTAAPHSGLVHGPSLADPVTVPARAVTPTV